MATVFKIEALPQALAKKLDLGMETVMQKMAVDLHSAIVERTPRDTGRAQSSWQLSIGDAGENLTPPEPGNYAKPDTLDVSAIDGKELIGITSGLVYIEPLENGHSKQAPAGMVALSVAELLTELEHILASELE